MYSNKRGSAGKKNIVCFCVNRGGWREWKEMLNLKWGAGGISRLKGGKSRQGEGRVKKNNSFFVSTQYREVERGFAKVKERSSYNTWE